MRIKRRVAIVWGKWGKTTDFVLEPTCTPKCNCDICKNAIWIEECVDKTSEDKSEGLKR